jgi:hypothetical protein
LPAWIQLASLASFLPPGLATLDALVDSTTHCETHTSRHFRIFSQIFQTMAPLIHGCPCTEPWTVENTRDWMDKAPTSTHDLSVWSSSSLGRWHPRLSVPLVLTRHSLLILNEWWTRVINLSMFFYYVMVLLNYFEVTSPASGSFFGDSMCLMLLLCVIQAL